jgi:pyruvate, orthophosphate dikinase
MYPEIYETQIEAILGAVTVVSDKGIPTYLEINYPHIWSRKELDNLRMIMARVPAGLCLKQRYAAETCVSIDTPRSVFVSKEIADGVESVCFDLDKLTEYMFGWSRNASQSVFHTYSQLGIPPFFPFDTIDIDGVGSAMRLASQQIKANMRSVKLGVVGNQGDDLDSIRFFSQIGMDYICCSPGRIPIARIAAAQAVLADGRVLREVQSFVSQS